MTRRFWNAPETPSGTVTSRRLTKPPAQPAGEASWLTTFADMVTLLLTFLVLIVSVTTMDPRHDFLRKEGVREGDESQNIKTGDGLLSYSNAGLLAPVIELVENLPRLPDDVMFDQEEIKTAIFQLDPAKTPQYEAMAEAAAEGVEIFRDQRGLVIQWDRALLFPEGGTMMMDDNLLLLRRLAVFLAGISLPISLESHTNPFSPLEGGESEAAYELSMRRSKVVMEYLVSLGLPEKRFRLAAYGGSRLRTTEADLAWENSRLEIVIYEPDRPALF